MRSSKSANTRVQPAAHAKWRRATMLLHAEAHCRTFSPTALSWSTSSLAMLQPSRVRFYVWQATWKQCQIYHGIDIMVYIRCSDAQVEKNAYVFTKKVHVKLQLCACEHVNFSHMNMWTLWTSASVKSTLNE